LRGHALGYAPLESHVLYEEAVTHFNCFPFRRVGETNEALLGKCPQTARPLCSPVELPDDFDSTSQYRLDLLFGTSAGEKEVTAASEGGLLSELASVGTESHPVADAEMAGVLERAAKEIGLEWKPLPRPKHSKLDDLYLGCDIPTPPPSPPSMRSPGGESGCKTRKTPLPSRACKFSSALVVKAYTASGQAASALQVYQAKVLRELHEGVPNPELLQELRSATDHTLRATKVMAQALGRAMSTMVVQGHHLWLTLAEMRDAEEVRFLDAPISQVGLFGDTVEEFAQHPAPSKPVLQPDPPNGPVFAGRLQGTLVRLQSVPETGSPEERTQLTCQDPLSTRGQVVDLDFFFSGPYSQHFCPSTKRPDADFSNQSMFWHTSCFHMFWKTPNLPSRRYPWHRRSSDWFLSGQIQWTKHPVAFGASHLQPQGLLHRPATMSPLQFNRLAEPSQTIRLGYAIQFARRPPKFSGILFASVRGTNAVVLRVEIALLLAMDEIEPVPSAKMKRGFYSHYFTVPKKGGGLHILTCVRVQHWFVAIDLKDAYFHAIPAVCRGRTGLSVQGPPLRPVPIVSLR
ncbi:hypothetical protein M9458_039419, partial [Cirrhinus mrigala]